MKNVSIAKMITMMTATVVVSTPLVLLLAVPVLFQYAFAAAGHDLPPSDLGGRKASLDFGTPAVASTSGPVGLYYSFVDLDTGKNIPHVTYVVTVASPEGRQVFSEVLHGHDGRIDLKFKPSDDGSERGQYRVNANYDNLAAGYVADYAGIIAVAGPVFASPGTYRVAVEVSGVDYDNTFLPEPLKYEHQLAVAETQRFAVSHNGGEAEFDVAVSSLPSPVEGVELRPESRQLVIMYPEEELMHFDDMQVTVEIQQEMMSGPFTASFNGIELGVREEQRDGDIVALVLNGTHLDIMQMEGSHAMDSETAASMQSAPANVIVITATTVVPEFHVALPAVAAAVLAAAVALARKESSRFADLRPGGTVL